MKQYTIQIDGRYYAGEGEEYKKPIEPSSSGFEGKGEKGESGLSFGQPITISGRRNLESHIKFILSKMQPVQMIITEVKESRLRAGR